jgi:serine/threonine protein kinase/WD40 repeat protein
MSDHNPSAADPFGQIADEFVEALRQGKRPSVEEFARRYPAHADDIRDMLPALALMEKAKSAADAPGQPRQAKASAAAVPLQQLGDYQILREVGRGGMGIVYEAQQLSLGRHVALKVLPSHALLDPRHLARFQREARAAAKLHHTNIVPVFGVGEQDGLHYYVMQFIPGLGLDVVLDELRRLRQPRGKPAPTPADAPSRPVTVTRDVSAADVAHGLLTGAFRRPGAANALTAAAGGPAAGVGLGAPTPVRAADSSATIHLPGQAEGSTLSDSGSQYWQSVARIGMQVADALAHAAGQGVLHRDIKPSNLLLDDTGNVWVTDFGLAKAASDGEDLTQTGDIVGTLRYMAPERFSGQGDLRSDVYSLGLTLYELLALRPAFDEADRNKLVKQVMHDEPVRPRKLNPGVPRDLETVVLKAIARDPAHRYQTPAEMAEDLKRFVEDRPVRARRISNAEKFWRWSRRNPGIAVLGGVLTAVLVLVTVASLLAAGHFNRLRLKEADARAAEAEQKQRAEEALHDAIDQTYLATRNEIRAMRLARASGWRSAALDKIRGLVRLGSRKLDRAELRTEALACLAEIDVRVESNFFVPYNLGAWHLQFSPDGRTLAVNDSEKSRVYLRDLANGRELASVPKSVGLAPFGFHPGGALAVPSAPGRVTFHALAPGQPTFPAVKGEGHALNLAFSRSGERLAVAWGDVDLRQRGEPTRCRRVTVHETATGATLRTIAMPANLGTTYKVPLALSPDGSSVATVSPGFEVQLYAVEGKADPVTLGQLDGRICAIAFHPEGRSLAAAGIRVAAVWDLQKRSELARMHAPAEALWDLAFSPDGQLLAGASNDGWGRLWDCRSGREVAAVLAQVDGVGLSVAFSPRGDRFAVGGVCFSPDAGWATVLAFEGRRERRTEVSQTYYVHDVVFDPIRPVLFHCGLDRRVYAWSLDNSVAQVNSQHQGTDTACPSVLRVTAGGSELVMGTIPFRNSPPGQDYSIRVWACDDPSAQRRLRGPQQGVVSIALNATDRRLAAGARDGRLYVWDFATGALLHHQELGAIGKALHFLDDSRLLIAAGKRLLLMSADNGEVIQQRTLPGVAETFVVTADGKEAIVGTPDGTIHRVRLPDLQVDQSRMALDHPSDLRMALSPDGALLAATIQKGTRIVLLDPQTLEPIAHLPELERVISSLAFDPKGRHLALGSSKVVLWDLTMVRDELARLGLDFGDRNGLTKDEK